MQERVKGPKPEYQWIGEANSIRLGKYLPCPPYSQGMSLFYGGAAPE